MRSRKLLAALLLMALALAACGLLNPPEKQRKSALDDFIYTLRWQLYPEAASYFASKHRQPFLDQFEKVRGNLNITEVRLQQVDFKDDGRRAEVRLEMDYYLLPSATLKTLLIDQTWVFFDTGDSEAAGFLITTPFPKIPGESSRSKSTLPP